MKIQLLSCECGSENIEIYYEDDFPIIRCKNCDYGVWDDDIEDINKLAKIWNNRKKPKWIEIEFEEKP